MSIPLILGCDFLLSIAQCVKKTIKHLEKFPNVFGWCRISINIPPRKEEEHHVYSLRVGRILNLHSLGVCGSLPAHSLVRGINTLPPSKPCDLILFMFMISFTLRIGGRHFQNAGPIWPMPLPWTSFMECPHPRTISYNKRFFLQLLLGTPL